MSEANVVYGLSLDGKTFRYVGLTRFGAEQRLSKHRYNARKGLSFPVYNWMRKHGPENVQVTVLEVCDESTLSAAECRWIEDLKNQGYNLLNVTSGGELGYSRPGRPLTDTHKAKVSAGVRRFLAESGGRTVDHLHTPETRAKVAETKAATAVQKAQRTCSIKNCNNKYFSKDWCQTHYGRWYRNGDPLIVKKAGRPRKTVQ